MPAIDARFTMAPRRRRALDDARRVQQHVHRSNISLDPLRQGFKILRNTHVDGVGPAADRIGKLGCHAEVKVGDHRQGPLRGKQLGAGLANAAGPAGDDRDTPLEALPRGGPAESAPVMPAFQTARVQGAASAPSENLHSPSRQSPGIPCGIRQSLPHRA